MSSSSRSSESGGIPGIPRVGAVRCYWALLAPHYTPITTSPYDPSKPPPLVEGQPPQQKLELEFVHFDPVLDAHLSKQKMSMMKRSVLEFIHPNEREQARRDLFSAISADDLQGSVTRVRFARLSRIRTILGCPPEENDFPVDAVTYIEDDEYLILDLVLNWVAEGLLLAFFHAIKDKDPVVNNDPARSHEEWSNLCGTKSLGNEQIEKLHSSIANVIEIPPLTRFPPERVFQLHLVNPEIPHQLPQLVFSWPPPRPPGVNTTYDGLYNAAEYCEMMKGVDMDPAQLTSGPGELRTNCTTRYGAQHSITTEGVYRHVTSVFIPYGSIVFACFQTTKMYELHSAQTTSTSGAPPPMLTTTRNGVSAGYTSLAAPNPIVSAHGDPWSSEPIPYAEQHAIPAASIHSQAQGLSSEWTSTPPQPNTLPRQQPQPSAWDSYHLALPPQPVAPLVQAPPTHIPISHHQNLHDTGYPTPSSSAPYNQHPQQHHYGQNLTPPHDYGGVPISATLMAESNSGNGSGGEGGYNGGGGGGGSSVNGGGGGSSSRPLVRPPGNVECCVMCGIKRSPEWRRNENGIKDLCNACGLRLARQVAKREGRQKPRKKKDQVGDIRGRSVSHDQYGMPAGA
ncbi:hypothetical protein CI109_103636 [Kwoniella shandongensis]|uniref:Uncharacterized protein n=1 Tax=Kwoniella shandongensis TaxID=1734106 RepID=A0A5M6C914_9TREE|nr:uncharacterized protein CI109_000672 [Kwoniella shandongensis]KAA5531100.1 hypothetical protein CI109_000672 [Kwoniella shandongensis]